jgi:hypothetical protein
MGNYRSFLQGPLLVANYMRVMIPEKVMAIPNFALVWPPRLCPRTIQ